MTDPYGRTEKGLLERILQRLDGLEVRSGRSLSQRAGTITRYGGGPVPAGVLLCNGQTVSRATYAALFAQIGTTYGAGDGSTTFNVPNLNGKRVTVPQATPLASGLVLDGVFAPETFGGQWRYEISAFVRPVAGNSIFLDGCFRSAGVDFRSSSYVFSDLAAGVPGSGTSSPLMSPIITGDRFYGPHSQSPTMQISIQVDRAGVADWTDFHLYQDSRNGPASSQFWTHRIGRVQSNQVFDGIKLFNADANPIWGWLQCIPVGGSLVPSLIATGPIS